MSEYLTFECHTCRKRFAGTHKTVLGIKACPKCNAEGAWWSLVNRTSREPHTGVAVAPFNRENQPPPRKPIRDTGFSAARNLAAPTIQHARHPLSPSLVFALGFSVIMLLIVSTIGAFMYGRSIPAENTPAPTNAPQSRSSSASDYPQKQRDESFKAYYRNSSRVSAQVLRLSDAMKLNNLETVSEEVAVLSKEFDSLTFAISDEQRTCTYTQEMAKAISLFKTGVENWKLALKFQDQAENGRFSMPEREELIKHALDCINNRNNSFRMGTEAVLAAGKAMASDLIEIDERTRPGK